MTGAFIRHGRARVVSGLVPARPSRRAVVVAALSVPAAPVVSAVAAGCTLSDPAAKPSPRAEPEVDPDVRLLADVAAGTQALVGLYEAVLDEHRDLRRDLRPLLAAHRAHARALGDAAPERLPGGQGGRGASDAPGTGTPRSPEPVDVPRRPAAAVRALRAAERDASRELLAATGDASSGPFARLLASMSAASAQHVQVLAGVGER